MRRLAMGLGLVGVFALAGCAGLSDEAPAYCVAGNDPDTGAPLQLCTYKPSDSCVEALDPRIRRRGMQDEFQWICPAAS
jgi:hypothetical protein